MSLYVIQGSTLGGIADAIRTKKGTSSLIAVTDLATEIASISGGGGAFSSGSVTITSGTTDPVTVEHGLGVEPNCIFVFSDARIAGGTEYFKGGWKFDNLCGYAKANKCTVVTAYNNELRGGALDNSCIINVDEDYFDITPQTYPFVPDGCTIYWFAIYVDTTS